MDRFLYILCFVATIYSCNTNLVNDVELVTAEEMKELSEIEDVQWVDVRTPAERKDGFIANSQNIDYNSPTFVQEIESLDKSKPVIVLCNSGDLCSKCANKMKDAGFVKIYDLEGGMAKWKFKGYNIEINPNM